MIAQAFPVLVLWNPYNTPIAASSYEFVCGGRYNGGTVKFYSSAGGYDNAATLKGTLVFSSSPYLRPYTGATKGDPANAPDDKVPDGGEAVRKYWRFTVDSPVIQAGQSLVFTLDSTGYYHPPGTPGAIPLTATPGGIPLPALDNSLLFATTGVVLTPAERAQKLKVVVGDPHFEIGLYPVQAAGSNPTVADMHDQIPYITAQVVRMTKRWPGTDLTVHTAPVTHPAGFFWMGLQMSKTSTNAQYYLNSRWLAQLNPRAPYHLYVPGGISVGGMQSMIGDSTENQANNIPADKFDGNRASAGPSRDAAPPSIPTINLQIAEFAPPSSAHPQSRFYSLAQLQHANLSLLGQTAGNAVGNSQPSFGIGPAATGLAASSTETRPADQVKRWYDLSYLLNQALWDRYFFSTIPRSLTDDQAADDTFHLPNARHSFHRDNGAALTAASLTETEAFNTAASRLLVNGGFNVNSASEQAWLALLSCHNKVDTSAGFTHPFSRFSSTAAGDPANTSWTSGYRILSDAQVRLLAQKIVAEVKARGPFLSLAGFVNRRVASAANPQDPNALKGPLQAAIDATDSDATSGKRINDRDPFNNSAYQVGASAYYPGPTATTDQKKVFLADANADATRPASSRAAFAPGFLTQADLLNSIGPALTVRSDTFVIRAYGDVQNPATSTIEGRAWCEAVVQRFPDYIDSSVNPCTAPQPNSPSEILGRRFKIISFRWLGLSDI